MAVDDLVLARAQRFEKAAMRALLEAVYGSVCRMAHGLSGREDVGRGVVRFVISQATKRLNHWRDGDEAQRWFHHHTVLTVRRASAHQPAPKRDVLLGGDGPAPAPYLAFVRALRGLPMQQREAFLLHHGEGFGPRAMSLAMDCSTQAAAMHLRQAEESLQKIAGQEFEPFKAKMVRVYQLLAPDQELMRPTLNRHLRGILWPRTIRRTLKLLIGLALAAGAAWIASQYRHFLPWP